MAYPYRMAPDAEVNGALMSAIFNHYRRDEVLESLKKHQLEYVEPDTWYPVNRFINLLTDWSKQAGLSSNLISVGIAMVYHIELSDNDNALDAQAKLMKLGTFFLSYHRSTGIGTFQETKIHEHHLQYTQSMVWPDDLMYGYIYGAAQRYLGHGKPFNLRYMDDAPRQGTGGAATTFDLTWE